MNASVCPDGGAHSTWHAGRSLSFSALDSENTDRRSAQLIQKDVKGYVDDGWLELRLETSTAASASMGNSADASAEAGRRVSSEFPPLTLGDFMPAARTTARHPRRSCTATRPDFTAVRP